MIDGGIQIAHQDVKMVGACCLSGLSATSVASNVCRWLTITDDRQVCTHNLTTLDAAPVRGSVPTTNLYGDPIAVNNAGTILSETEVSHRSGTSTQQTGSGLPARSPAASALPSRPFR
jgi:hypothetical protein